MHNIQNIHEDKLPMFLQNVVVSPSGHSVDFTLPNKMLIIHKTHINNAGLILDTFFIIPLFLFIYIIKYKKQGVFVY